LSLNCLFLNIAVQVVVISPSRPLRRSFGKIVKQERRGCYADLPPPPWQAKSSQEAQQLHGRF
jgi:hypothetical protein